MNHRIRASAIRTALLLTAPALVALAPTPASAATSDTAYVTNNGGDSVTPIDTGTDTAGTTFGGFGSSSGPAGIAITPDGATAYVALYDAQVVAVVDTASDAVTDTIPVDYGPRAIAITPDGLTAYVTNYGSGTVTPINTVDNTTGDPIPVAVGSSGIAITPNGATAYVTNLASDTVIPINIADNTTGDPIFVGGNPYGIAITPDGATAYVTRLDSDSVIPINIADNTTGDSISVGNTPFAIAITPDGATAYVTNANSHNVTPINIADNTTGDPIAVGGYPFGIAITPDAATAYVTNANSANVTPIQIADNTTGDPIPAGSEPNSIAITPEQAPVAAFSSVPGVAGEASSFDASGSSDVDGTVATYEWDFGDGNIATTATPTTTHVYATPDTYTATVTVFDDAGCSVSRVFTGQTVSCNGKTTAAISHPVVVTAAVGGPPPPPVLDLDSDGDGLTDAQETGGSSTLKVRTASGVQQVTSKSDPRNPDTDADGLTDGQEVNGVAVKTRIYRFKKTAGKRKLVRVPINTFFSDPSNPDTDGDGLTDIREFRGFKTGSGFCRPDPANFNTDFAKFSDGYEKTREKPRPQNPCRPGD